MKSESRTGLVTTTVIVAAGIVVVGASQWVAADEVTLVTTFLERVRTGDPRAGELCDDAVRAGLGTPDPTVAVLRHASGFANASVVSVGWGERCILVDAVGTEVTELLIAVSEGDEGFVVSGITLDVPAAGPCAND